VGEPEGKRPSGNPTSRRVNNIKLILERRYRCMGSISLGSGPVEGSSEHSN
jgi:hypothetical protein